MSDSVLIDRALLATVLEYARGLPTWRAKEAAMRNAAAALEGPAIQNPPDSGRLSLEQGSDQIYTLNEGDPYQGVTIRVRNLAVRVNVSDDGLWAKITHREGGPVKEAAYVLWEGVGEDDYPDCDEDYDETTRPDRERPDA